MQTDLWKRVNYKAPIPYIFNTYITEYDLSKANITALLYTGRIDESKYKELLNLPKYNREVAVGLMTQKDSTIYESIQKGIIEAKKRLFASNSIEDYEVLSIRNDAVFIHSRKLMNAVFPPFEFKTKGEYNMYMSVCDLDLFYKDIINMDNTISTVLDIKGISEEKLQLHQNGMANLICEVMYRLQREDVSITISWLTDLLQKYMNRELPKEYYREFNADSEYVICTFAQRIPSMYITDDMVSCVDINRNLLIIRDILAILTNVHMSNLQRKKKPSRR